ncbi:MAG: hypothetical protein KA444_02240 [Bacteroidia bacterium]|nr:hypothetical protein [Bacteroidia bacterium]
MKKKIIFSILFVIAGVAITGAYFFNKPRESVRYKEADVVMEASALVSEYESDESGSNTKFLGKIIEVTGVVSATFVDENGIINITLQGGDLAGVGCQFEKNKKADVKKLNTGDKVTIKGICTGILMDVVLVDCVITS